MSASSNCSKRETSSSCSVAFSSARTALIYSFVAVCAARPSPLTSRRSWVSVRSAGKDYPKSFSITSLRRRLGRSITNTYSSKEARGQRRRIKRHHHRRAGVLSNHPPRRLLFMPQCEKLLSLGAEETIPSLPSALLLALIHPSAWNGDSRKFALKEFCELRPNGVLRSSANGVFRNFGWALQHEVHSCSAGLPTPEVRQRFPRR